ncbi:MAG: cell division protein FtsZ [Coprobacillus sp.]|nr:cell division protein FtsZ [Coprobacillus sp.]
MASGNYDLDNFEPACKIVVIGVGGAGSNAVNRMIDDEIANVTFYVLNTDKQALSSSKASNRTVLGENTTGGLGAGGVPEVGEKAAEESADAIREMVNGADLVFIAAGMGGGTGTGAAPVVARIAKDAGALVVAIVTRPFTFEGQTRINNSIDGLNKLKENVDSIIVVSNDQLLRNVGTIPIPSAFAESDKVLSQSVKTVVNLILLPAVINLDFADVRNTLQHSGVGLIGSGYGKGPNRAKDAALSAISSPLLEASVAGARRAIVSVTCGTNVSLFDAQDTVRYLIEAAGRDIDIKFGVSINDQLDDEIIVSVIAADFEQEMDFSQPLLVDPITRPTIEEAPIEESEPEKSEEKEELDKSNILPSFLKQ